MTFELERMGSALSALRAEAERSPDPARARVCTRLSTSIPELAPASTGAPTTPESLLVRAQPGKVAFPGKLWLIGTFALGGAVGAGVHAAFQQEPESRVVYVDRVASPAPKTVEPTRLPALPVPGSESELTPATTDPALTVAPRARVPSKPERPKKRANVDARAPSSEAEAPDLASLGEQQALLDRARLALNAGNPSAALALVAHHARRFPESALEEERDALTIKALSASGQRSEARASFERFRERFSRSPLLPSLEAAASRTVTESSR
jgi:hypothetical protein